jgi:hypothetical protein
MKERNSVHVGRLGLPILDHAPAQSVAGSSTATPNTTVA